MLRPTENTRIYNLIELGNKSADLNNCMRQGVWWKCQCAEIYGTVVSCNSKGGAGALRYMAWWRVATLLLQQPEAGECGRGASVPYNGGVATGRGCYNYHECCKSFKFLTLTRVRWCNTMVASCVYPTELQEGNNYHIQLRARSHLDTSPTQRVSWCHLLLYF